MARHFTHASLTAPADMAYTKKNLLRNNQMKKTLESGFQHLREELDTLPALPQYSTKQLLRVDQKEGGGKGGQKKVEARVGSPDHEIADFDKDK
ncbi:hypothetical protein ACLOJK_013191 [Asimina triloba]